MVTVKTYRNSWKPRFLQFDLEWPWDVNKSHCGRLGPIKAYNYAKLQLSISNSYRMTAHNVFSLNGPWIGPGPGVRKKTLLMLNGLWRWTILPSFGALLFKLTSGLQKEGDFSKKPHFWVWWPLVAQWAIQRGESGKKNYALAQYVDYTCCRITEL